MVMKRISRIISFFESEGKLSWFIVLVGMGLIFFTSSVSFGAGTPGTNFISMVYHIQAYFFLGIFLMIAISKGSNGFHLIPAILISLAYGFSDEIHQYFVPGRACSFFDLGLDAVGISLAFLIYFIIFAYREKKIIPKIPKI